MTTTPSLIEDLNSAIKENNPFDKSLVVKQAEIWGKGFPDAPSINAYASDAVIDEIRKIQAGKRSSIGLTITAEKGLGKSHIISRIRHQLQIEGGALFVCMADFSDLKRLKSIFLQTLVFSLKREGSQKVSQWQELATDLINDVFGKNFNPQYLVEQVFPKQIAQRLAKGIKPVSYVDSLRSKVLDIKSDLTDNPYLIQALLWTLSKPHATFAINWLCGKMLAQTQSDEMGLPNPQKELDETSSFNLICQLLDLIGTYKTLVICFDELDGVGGGDTDSPYTRSMVAASLIKDVYNLTKNGVFLTVMYPQTWRDEIRTMPRSEAVTDRIGERVLDLKYLNSDDVVNLVTIWLQDFYGQKELIPVHPLYPFDELELRELGKEKLIVRRVLQWCKDNFKVPSIIEPKTEDILPQKHPVENAFNEQLADLEISIDEYLDDKHLLAYALWLCFVSLIGETVEGVKVDDIEEFQHSTSEQNNSPDFKIIGDENGKTIKIGVMVHQISSGQGVQAGLKKLVNYKKLDITRGCLVRSKAISRGAAKAQVYLQQLLESQGGEWVLLQAEDIKPLLAIAFVYASRDDYELSDEHIFDFIEVKELAINNPLIREILSDPSGQQPDNLIDEDIPIIIPENVSSSEDEIDLAI